MSSTVTCRKSTRFDASLLFSVDYLIEAKSDEDRKEACLVACEQVAARAHSWLNGENDPVKLALFRVLDSWYAKILSENSRIT